MTRLTSAWKECDTGRTEYKADTTPVRHVVLPPAIVLALLFLRRADSAE